MKHFFSITLLSFILLAGCQEDPEQAANKLFVEASQLWDDYQNLPREESAVISRIEFLTQIKENLDSIVEDFPESSLAVELASTGRIKQIEKAEIENHLFIMTAFSEP